MSKILEKFGQKIGKKISDSIDSLKESIADGISSSGDKSPHEKLTIYIKGVKNIGNLLSTDYLIPLRHGISGVKIPKKEEQLKYIREVWGSSSKELIKNIKLLEKQYAKNTKLNKALITFWSNNKKHLSSLKEYTDMVTSLQRKTKSLNKLHKDSYEHGKKIVQTENELQKINNDIKIKTELVKQASDKVESELFKMYNAEKDRIIRKLNVEEKKYNDMINNKHSIDFSSFDSYDNLDKYITSLTELTVNTMSDNVITTKGNVVVPESVEQNHSAADIGYLARNILIALTFCCNYVIQGVLKVDEIYNRKIALGAVNAGVTSTEILKSRIITKWTELNNKKITQRSKEEASLADKIALDLNIKWNDTKSLVDMLTRNKDYSDVLDTIVEEYNKARLSVPRNNIQKHILESFKTYKLPLIVSKLAQSNGSNVGNKDFMDTVGIAKNELITLKKKVNEYNKLLQKDDTLREKLRETQNAKTCINRISASIAGKKSSINDIINTLPKTISKSYSHLSKYIYVFAVLCGALEYKKVELTKLNKYINSFNLDIKLDSGITMSDCVLFKSYSDQLFKDLKTKRNKIKKEIERLKNINTKFETDIGKKINELGLNNVVDYKPYHPAVEFLKISMGLFGDRQNLLKTSVDLLKNISDKLEKLKEPIKNWLDVLKESEQTEFIKLCESNKRNLFGKLNLYVFITQFHAVLADMLDSKQEKSNYPMIRKNYDTGLKDSIGKEEYNQFKDCFRKVYPSSNSMTMYELIL